MLNDNNNAIALGYFDGIHLGHQSVISAVAESKNSGFNPSILLFDKHPVTVLKNIYVPSLITLSDRDLILKNYGLTVFTESFSEICNLSPEDFFYEILLKKLNAGFISCGFNYTFGKSGAGTVKLLQNLCDKNGVILTVSSEQKIDGISISSTAIRNALETGNIELANKLLGRPFSFESTVLQGDHRGRKIGSPTINQNFPDGLVVPAFGVYASFVYIDNKKFAGVSDVGNRPTFKGHIARCETFILNFEGDLYGKKIRTELLEYIRPEKKFDSVECLIDEIRNNADYVRNKYIK